MATNVNVQSFYAGKDAGKLFLESFKEVDAIKNGAFTLYENVNYKLNLRKVQTTNGRYAYTCGFAPAGSVTLSEKQLAPEKFKDDFQICKEDFRAQWGEESMGASAHNNVMDKAVLDAIVADKLARNADAFSEEIWQGTGTSGQIEGLLTKFADDEDVIKVAGTVITEQNVEAELKKALAAVPVQLRRKDLKISVSADVAQAYSFHLISKGIANGLGGNANASLVFGNATLVEDAGLPASTIVIADPANLVFATATLADHNEIKVVDEDEIGLLTGNVRGTMVYNAGVDYIYGAEIVWYFAD